jgi:ribosomal protein L37E
VRMTVLPDVGTLDDRMAGAMTIVVCRDCGRADWFVMDADVCLAADLTPFYALGYAENACAVCGGSSRRRVRARERASQINDVVDRAIAIHVGYSGWRLLGSLEIHVCQSCGLAEWMGVELKQLKADASAGLGILDATEERGGPYR